jgi:hypothetical protein
MAPNILPSDHAHPLKWKDLHLAFKYVTQGPGHFYHLSDCHDLQGKQIRLLRLRIRLQIVFRLLVLRAYMYHSS